MDIIRIGDDADLAIWDNIHDQIIIRNFDKTEKEKATKKGNGGVILSLTGHIKR